MTYLLSVLAGLRVCRYPFRMLYTPITPRTGGLVHATTLRSMYRTVCGLTWSGWRIAPLRLTCSACEEALYNATKYGSKKGKGKRRKL